MFLLTKWRLNSSSCFTYNSHFMILTQILIYTIYNTLCDNNVVVHRFIQKALHYLTGARLISTFSVKIETGAIVFKLDVVSIRMFRCSVYNTIHNFISLKSYKVHCLFMGFCDDSINIILIFYKWCYIKVDVY